MSEPQPPRDPADDADRVSFLYTQSYFNLSLPLRFVSNVLQSKHNSQLNMRHSLLLRPRRRWHLQNLFPNLLRSVKQNLPLFLLKERQWCHKNTWMWLRGRTKC